MSTNLQTINQIIICDDNNDILKEQKLREKEEYNENLDINKSYNNSQKKENSDNEYNNSSKKVIIENKNENSLNSKSLNEINNSDNINKNDILSEIIIQSPEKTISIENIKNNENSELLQIKNDISNISSINNQSSATNKTNEKTILTKKDKYKLKDKQLSKNTKEKNNIKKLNNNNAKRKQQNKNKIIDTNNNNKKLKIKDDSNFFTQNVSLQLDNIKKLNNSMEKRIKKIIETNVEKSHDKTHDIIRDKSKDKNFEKFNLMYKKFEEKEKKKLEKIEQMKKKQEETNKLIYIYKPKINLKSKEIVAKKKENSKDFYERQKILMEKYKKNDEILKEKINKEKERENKIKNFNKDKYNYVKSKLYDWQEKQKTINNSNINESTEKDDNNSENTNTIYKIKVNRNINRIINRLYKNDLEKRKNNLEILNNIFTPSFQPNLLESWKNSHKLKNKSKDINPNNYRSSQRIKTNVSLEILDNKEDENNNMRNSINVTDLLRNRLFNKKKKKERYNSEIIFNNVINDINIYEAKDDNDSCKYNKIKIYKNPKLSRSFVRQKNY